MEVDSKRPEPRKERLNLTNNDSADALMIIGSMFEEGSDSVYIYAYTAQPGTTTFVDGNLVYGGIKEYFQEFNVQGPITSKGGGLCRGVVIRADNIDEAERLLDNDFLKLDYIAIQMSNVLDTE